MSNQARNPQQDPHTARRLRPGRVATSFGVIAATVAASWACSNGEKAPVPVNPADNEPVAPATASPFPAETPETVTPATSASPEASGSDAPAVTETTGTTDPHRDLRQRVAAAVADCTVRGYNDEGTKPIEGRNFRILVFDTSLTVNPEAASLDRGSNAVDGTPPAFVPTQIGKDGIPTGKTYPSERRPGGTLEVRLPAKAADGTRVTLGTETSASSEMTDGGFVTTTEFVPCGGPSTVEFDTKPNPDKWMPADTLSSEPYVSETIG